jgi:hypothetical protein
MYHLGIVRHVIAPGVGGVVGSDTTVQAVVRMWDDNLLILGVEASIAKKLKKGNYVLADYTPLSPEARNRKLSLTKILPEADGSKLWAEFQDEFDRRRNIMQQQQPMR